MLSNKLIYKIIKCFYLSIVPILAGTSYDALAITDDSKLIRVKVSNGVFDPINKSNISYNDTDINIQALHSGNKLQILIQKKGETSKISQLPDELVQVDAIQRGVNNKAVITGSANPSVSVVAIIDTASGNLIDHFWAYQPTLSPNGQLLAFINFFPAHFVRGTDDQYRLYDLSLSPAANRYNFRAVKKGEPESDPVTDVGIPLYSLRKNEKNRLNVEVPEKESHQHHSEFFWSADSSNLVFADSQNKTMSLIIVSIQAQTTRIFELKNKYDVCLGNCFNVSLDSVRLFSDKIQADFKGTRNKSYDRSFSIKLDQFLSIR